MDGIRSVADPLYDGSRSVVEWVEKAELLQNVQHKVVRARYFL